MAELIIDLSGRKGLCDGFFGDADMVVPKPELRIDDDTGFASGYFNPFLRDGYMAPTTTTSVSYTADAAVTTVLSAVEYDHKNNVVYWSTIGGELYKAESGVSDTSLQLMEDHVNATYPNRTFDNIYDLQMYSLNGDDCLYYIGKGIPMSATAPEAIAQTTVADSYISCSIAAIPYATTKPTITMDDRVSQTTSGSTLTRSITVPSSTNRALVVVVFWPSNTTISSVTFDGVSMTSETNTTMGPSCRIYKLANPTATTANVVVTWSSSVSSCVMHSFVFDNTDQTSIIEGDTYLDQSPDSATVFVEIEYVHPNQLTLVASYVDDTTLTETSDKLNEINSGTNTYGADASWEYTPDVINGLVIGTNVIEYGLNNSWLASDPIGAFMQEIRGDFAFMRTADNGFAYVFSDNHVHKIDGTTTGGATGTVTKDVLLFPDNFRITDALDYRSSLYIATHQYPVVTQTTSLNNYTGKVGIYVWNRISTQLSSADYIELPGVREIKKIYASPDGVVKLITISDNGTTELREFGYNDSGGVVFPVKKRLGIGAFPQFPDGLSTAGDKVTWIANDGNMYTEKNNAVSKMYQIKAPGTGTTGLMSNVKTGALFYGSGVETASNSYRTNKQGISFSYLDGSTVYTKKIYPFDLTTGANASQTPHQGDVYSQVKLVPQGSAVRNIRIYNAPVSGSDSTVIATVKVYFNQGTTASMPSGMTKSITKAEAKRGYVDFHINKQYLHAVQIEVEWATGTPLGDDMYLPSVAVVTYDELKTQSPDNG